MIHQNLVLDARPDFTSSYVIHGLGGVGKTQLAIEHSYLHHSDFDIIYWLRADDYETLLRSYSQLYVDSSFRSATGLNLGDENDFEKISAQVILWFERCRNIRCVMSRRHLLPVLTLRRTPRASRMLGARLEPHACWVHASRMLGARLAHVGRGSRNVGRGSRTTYGLRSPLLYSTRFP